MAASIFPKEWWKLSPEEYHEARAEMRALAKKDCEQGTKEVNSFIFTPLQNYFGGFYFG